MQQVVVVAGGVIDTVAAQRAARRSPQALSALPVEVAGRALDLGNGVEIALLAAVPGWVIRHYSNQI